MAKRKINHRQLARIKQAQAERRSRSAERAAVDTPDDGDLGPPQPGLVTANYGPALIVEDDAGALHRCALRQHIGRAVCGDRVSWQASRRSGGDDVGTSAGVVVAVDARRTLLSKPDYGGQMRPVAANIDQAALVIAPRPEPSESLIDRYLVTLERLDIDALLVLNKADLPTPDERERLLERFGGFRAIGYPLLLVSSRTGLGLDELRARLQHRANVLLGQSGVGKSSLTNALVPDLNVRVQALSTATGLGTHTTTTSMLYHLPDGGRLIDSPGVRSFEPGEADLADLEYGFVEFRPYLGRCKFSNCAHRDEPDCALRDAVARGDIDPRRLQSFLQISARRARPRRV